ncbi:unnamed protein product, partial [marine sediment metagenome]
MTLIKASAVRRKIGLQVSPEALDVLERHISTLLSEAERSTIKEGRHRVDGIAMRRCLPILKRCLHENVIHR